MVDQIDLGLSEYAGANGVVVASTQLNAVTYIKDCLPPIAMLVSVPIVWLPTDTLITRLT